MDEAELEQIEQAGQSKTQHSARHLFSQTMKIMMLLLLFLRFVKPPSEIKIWGSELNVYKVNPSSPVNI